MDISNDNLVIIVIGLIISLFIWYLIIQSAVKSGIATADSWNQHYLRINNRLLITLLARQGMSLEDIKVIIQGSDDQFWSTLMPKDPPPTPIYKS